VGSTNDVALDHARRGAPEGLVVVADVQRSGRGRRGRSWLAPPGSSLLVSVLLRPELPPERLHLGVAAVALAAADACAAVAGVRPGLKWPNDLVVGDAKLGGVLAEVEAGAVVVGLGLNVAWDSSSPSPSPLPAGVVDLAGASGRVVTRDALLAGLLDALAARVVGGEWAGVASAYRAACATLGRRVRVELDDESFTGTAADVADDGALLVDVGACLRTVSAGEVVHLRPLSLP
jgi:BirA family biotin operon repressor/biotin-[acetyl-CoA-carboxylase] ligase